MLLMAPLNTGDGMENREVFPPDATRRGRGRAARALVLAVGLVAVAALVVALRGDRAPITPPAMGRGLPMDARTGVLYVAAGPEDTQSRLFRLDLTTMKAISVGGGDFLFSDIQARDGLVVAAGAELGGGFALDHIYMVEGDKLAPIPGLGNPGAFCPVLDSPHSVTYSESLLVGKGEALVRWNFSTRRRTELARSPYGFCPRAAGPHGELLFTSDLKDFSHRFLLRSGARTSVLRVPGEVLRGSNIARWLPSADIIALAWRPDWRPGPPVALSEQASFLLEPATGRVLGKIEGWLAIDWSPDGRLLLLARGPELGIARAPAFDSVEVIGRSPVGSVWNGIWTAPEAPSS